MIGPIIKHSQNNIRGAFVLILFCISANLELNHRFCFCAKGLLKNHYPKLVGLKLQLHCLKVIKSVLSYTVIVSPDFHWQKSLSTVSCNLSCKLLVMKIWPFCRKFHWPSCLLCQHNSRLSMRVTLTAKWSTGCLTTYAHNGNYFSSQHLHATLTCQCKAKINQA